MTPFTDVLRVVSVLWFKRNWAEAAHACCLMQYQSTCQNYQFVCNQGNHSVVQKPPYMFLQYIHMNFVTDLNCDLSMYVGVAKLIVI